MKHSFCTDRLEIELTDAARAASEVAEPRLALAKWLYWSRSVRPGTDDPRLFGEPAWDMVLDLYIHQAKGLPTSVTSACAGSNAPATTALRYIELLCELGWVEKIRDDSDKRRSFIALTPMAMEKMEKHLDRMLERLWRIAPEFLPTKSSGEPDADRKRA